VTGDLRARRQSPEIGERKLHRRFDEAADIKLPIGEILVARLDVVGIVGVDGAVGFEPGERSAGPYSGASASRGASRARCTLRVRLSAASRMERLSVDSTGGRIPTIPSDAADGDTRQDMSATDNGLTRHDVLLDGVTTGNHRNHIVQKTRDKHHDDMNKDKSTR